MLSCRQVSGMQVYLFPPLQHLSAQLIYVIYVSTAFAVNCSCKLGFKYFSFHTLGEFNSSKFLWLKPKPRVYCVIMFGAYVWQDIIRRFPIRSEFLEMTEFCFHQNNWISFFSCRLLFCYESRTNPFRTVLKFAKEFWYLMSGLELDCGWDELKVVLVHHCRDGLTCSCPDCLSSFLPQTICQQPIHENSRKLITVPTQPRTPSPPP